MTITCKNCKKKFDGNKGRKFCSKSCATTFNNQGVIRNPRKRRVTCLNCETPLTKESQKKFCSQICSAKYNRTIKVIPLIESGKCTHPATLKKYLFEIRGEKCEICGQGNIWNGKPLMLQIDHIDGNSDNNNLDNLRIICGHCHSQTETFTGRNVKNTKRNSYLRKYKNAL